MKYKAKRKGLIFRPLARAANKLLPDALTLTDGRLQRNLLNVRALIASHPHDINMKKRYRY